MSIANKDEWQKYGIKYTTKGTPYMLTNFWFHDRDDNYKEIWKYDVEKIYDELKEKWKVFHERMNNPKPGQQEYRVTTSIMYGNNGKWERNSFADSAIGFVFEDGYKYKQMFMHNMHCGARPIKLDEKGKSITSWDGKEPKQIWNKKTKEYETKELTDETNEGYRDYYDKMLNDKENEEQFVEKSIEKDNLRKGLFQQKKQKNKVFATAVQNYNSGKLGFKPYYDDSDGDINDRYNILEGKYDKKIQCQYGDNDKILNYELYQDDLYLRHNRLTFQNNECHVDVWPPKIASLIINLTDRDIAERAIRSVRNNKRWMRLKQIAYSMESILKFQRDVLKKDKILFRDEEKQEIELLTLEQFKDRITNLCEKHNRQCKKEEEKIDMDKVKFPDEQIQQSDVENISEKKPQQSNVESKIQEDTNANIITKYSNTNITEECFQEPKPTPPKKHGLWCRFKKWFQNLFAHSNNDQPKFHINTQYRKKYNREPLSCCP